MNENKEILKFATQNQILDLMKRHKSAIIIYRSDADKGEMLTRYIDGFYVLGYTKANNLAVRAYQGTGGSVSGQNAGWKIFRLDRIVQVVERGDMLNIAPSGYDEDDDALHGIIYSQPVILPTNNEPTGTTATTTIEPTTTLVEWIKKLKNKLKKKK